MTKRKAGQSCSIRVKIAEIMRDGRERTTNDVVRATGGSTDSDHSIARRALSDMAAMGLISRDTKDQFAIWRARA